MTMQFDFLNAFPKRMKNVGMYALLLRNSRLKGVWKEFEFNEEDEQLNVDFAVLLYIMEMSLREIDCTMDEIAIFIDDLNAHFFKKPMTRDACFTLGSFIVNTVLSNEGMLMTFKGFDFETSQYRDITISYVTNRIVYPEPDTPRTAYSLTDDGYNLVLGTLEIESNLKISVQELIFRMHLERQNYDQALTDIKNIFGLMHVQLQKNADAMYRIRQNALAYNVDEFRALMDENMATIRTTEEKFEGYRKNVRTRRMELEENHYDIGALSKEEQENLYNLKEIERYLNRTLDEHHRILDIHLDLKDVYRVELAKIRQMSVIKRFPFRSEFFDKVLADPSTLSRLSIFLNPLFNRPMNKSLNPNILFESQRVLQSEEDAGVIEDVDFDADRWAEEQQQRRQEKLNRLKDALTCLLELLSTHKTLSMASLSRLAEDPVRQARLLPNIAIFKELFIELVRFSCLDIRKLREERATSVNTEMTEFSLSRMLLSVLDEHPEWKSFVQIDIDKATDPAPVFFENIPDETGEPKVIRCTNIRMRLTQEEENNVVHV